MAIVVMAYGVCVCVAEFLFLIWVPVLIWGYGGDDGGFVVVVFCGGGWLCSGDGGSRVWLPMMVQGGGAIDGGFPAVVSGNRARWVVG